VTASEHGAVISPGLLAEVEPLAERFSGAGYHIYLVGGIVRDQLLGVPLAGETDVDLTTDAHPTTIKELVRGLADAVWTQGERFGTIGCHIGGRSYEITTHRDETYDPDSRKPLVEFSAAIEHDLSRRDFTVNAMAVALPTGELVDPYGGRADLAAHLLRTPLAPEVSFSDDPLRMLRAARFVAGYGLEPDAGLVAAIAPLAPRMAIVSVERRRDELDKLLAVEDPTAGLRLMLATGLGPYVLPDLAASAPHVVERAVAAVAALPARGWLRLAALLALDEEPDAASVGRRMRELRYANDVIAAVQAVVRGAALVWSATTMLVDADVRRLAAATGAHLDSALRLASTRLDTAMIEARVDDLRSREDLDALDVPLDGDAVMAQLGLGPGVVVGEALAHLRELRIVEGPLDEATARARLHSWWQRRAAVG
jgi:poly(A) polymerase